MTVDEAVARSARYLEAHRALRKFLILLWDLQVVRATEKREESRRRNQFMVNMMRWYEQHSKRY